MNKEATVYLIPSTLGKEFNPDFFPEIVKKIIETTYYFIVENEKEGRRFIKNICPSKVQSTLKIYTLNKHSKTETIENYLDPCVEGNDMAVISDAGCPGIADPGAVIVEKAHLMGFRVKPLPGPSSILLAMMSSGLNGQNFAFNGYLPIDKAEQKKTIKALETKSAKLNQSQLFMETPYRNVKLMDNLMGVLSDETQLSVAYQLTQSDEFIKTLRVSLWKKTKIDFHKKPAIFIIHKKN